MGRVVRTVRRAVSAVKSLKFLKKINPWVALGVFAVG